MNGVELIINNFIGISDTKIKFSKMTILSGDNTKINIIVDIVKRLIDFSKVSSDNKYNVSKTLALYLLKIDKFYDIAIQYQDSVIYAKFDTGVSVERKKYSKRKNSSLIDFHTDAIYKIDEEKFFENKDTVLNHEPCIGTIDKDEYGELLVSNNVVEKYPIQQDVVEEINNPIVGDTVYSLLLNYFLSCNDCMDTIKSREKCVILRDIKNFSNDLTIRKNLDIILRFINKSKKHSVILLDPTYILGYHLNLNLLAANVAEKANSKSVQKLVKKCYWLASSDLAIYNFEYMTNNVSIPIFEGNGLIDYHEEIHDEVFDKLLEL